MPGQVGCQHARQELLAGLHRALGPAVLLVLEGVHLDRHFGQRDQVLQVDEAPALHLGAVGQIEVLRQGVVLPAPGIVDRGTAPDAGRAVEVEEAPGTAATAVLDDEVPIEQHRLHLRQQRVLTVDVAPACLDERHLGVFEVANRLLEDVHGRHEVGVEDQHQLALGQRQAVVQGAGLVAGAIAAVHVMDVEALGSVALDCIARDLHRLVGGVVEHLDLEQLARIADARDGVEQALDHVHLVVERELHGHAWQPRGQGHRHGTPITMAIVEEQHDVPVHAHDRQDHQCQEIKTEQRSFSGTHGVADNPPRTPSRRGRRPTRSMILDLSSASCIGMRSLDLDSVCFRKGTSGSGSVAEEQALDPRSALIQPPNKPGILYKPLSKSSLHTPGLRVALGSRPACGWVVAAGVKHAP